MGNRQAKIKHFELNEKVGQIKQIFLLKIFKLMRDILWNFILMFTYARTHIRKHLHKPVKRAGMRGHRSDCPLFVHVRANVYVCVCGRLFTQNCSPNRSSSSWSVWMEEREKITGLNSLQYVHMQLCVCACGCVADAALLIEESLYPQCHDIWICACNVTCVRRNVCACRQLKELLSMI